MTRILVPLDGSDLAEAALPVAEWLARGLRAEVVLLTVGELPETATQAAEERTELEQVFSRAKASHLSGLVVHQRIDTGRDPVHGILKAVEEELVDLIVMSTHGRSGLSALAQGSVAAEVVREGVVPVTLVRPRQACDRRAQVATMRPA